MKEHLSLMQKKIAKGAVNLLFAASSMISLSVLADHPLHNTVIEKCKPAIYLQPQKVGSRPHLVIPPGCYALMGGGYAQPDGFTPVSN